MTKDQKRIRVAIGLVALSASQLGAASIGYLSRSWKSGVVQTCWTDDLRRFKREVPTLSLPDGRAALPTNAENDEIQSWIGAAYSRERVGVEFRGFADCVPGKAVDALLVFNANLDSPNPSKPGSVMQVRGLGSTGNFSKTGSLVNRITSIVSGRPIESGAAFNRDGLRADVLEIENHMKSSIPLHLPPESRGRPDLAAILARFNSGIEADIPRWAVLHEFGHLTGLLHEERRKDVTNEQPGFCGGSPLDTFQENTKSKEESRFGTEFDPFSVMNYCRKNEQVLYHEAVLVCQIGETDLAAGFTRLTGKVPKTLAPLIANCDFIRSHSFPIDLTPRDVAGLRFLYLKETPVAGPAVSYKRSEDEKKWLEIFTQTDRLYL